MKIAENVSKRDNARSLLSLLVKIEAASFEVNMRNYSQDVKKRQFQKILLQEM